MPCPQDRVIRQSDQDNVFKPSLRGAFATKQSSFSFRGGGGLPRAIGRAFARPIGSQRRKCGWAKAPFAPCPPFPAKRWWAHHRSARSRDPLAFAHPTTVLEVGPDSDRMMELRWGAKDVGTLAEFLKPAGRHLWLSFEMQIGKRKMSRREHDTGVISYGECAFAIVRFGLRTEAVRSNSWTAGRSDRSPTR